MDNQRTGYGTEDIRIFFSTTDLCLDSDRVSCEKKLDPYT